MTRRLGAFSGILVATLLATAFGVFRPKAAEDRFSDKANLALRRTAHQLLRAVGDTTSRISPVVEGPSYTFSIQMGRTLNYDCLPAVLQESLNAYKISRSYDVAVRDCATEELQLGYTFSDLLGKQGVPCGGRLQKQGCYILQVVFEPPAETPYPLEDWHVLGAVSLLGAVFYVVWRRSRKPDKETGGSPATSVEGISDAVSFANSVYMPASLLLISGAVQHSLTYREAKLLRFFLNHPNEVLERDVILKEVWEDEGVTVGRSVDVFVSRLRKLLQNDPAVQIKAVHGVGYRFEIS